MDRRPPVIVLACLAVLLPLAYLLAYGPICRLYLQGWISTEAWLWLSQGPWGPVDRWCFSGDGPLWELYWRWMLLWDVKTRC